jgi:hypothetical protein
VSDLFPAPDPKLPQVRVGDVERQELITILQQHYAAGRLTLAEFEDRSEQAWKSRTRGELDRLVVDLPAHPSAPVRRGPPERPRTGPSALSIYLRFWIPLSVMFVLIWAMSGFGYFWPMWPMFGTSIPMLFLLGGHGDRGR